MNEIDDIYIKAFNQAYLLAKYNSELIQKILEHENDGNYFEALHNGKRTYELELRNSRLKQIENLKQKKNKNRDIER